MARLEQRLRQLEQRLHHQEEALREKDRTIAEATRRQEALQPRWERVEEKLVDRADAPGGWLQDVEIGGLVEVEAGWTDPHSGDDESDVVLATVEMGIGVRINDWTGAEMLFLHQGDETDPEVDVGTITIADPAAPWALTGGQLYLPFGTFDTHMVSDPLTLELGETRETALVPGMEKDGFAGGVYVFNGDNDADGNEDLDDWSAVAGYAVRGETLGLAANLGLLGDLGDADAVQDASDATPAGRDGVAEGGTGNDADPVAAQIAVEF